MLACEWLRGVNLHGNHSSVAGWRHMRLNGRDAGSGFRSKYYNGLSKLGV
jgi:hypothetical protein